ncbi:MAG: hypothetical protein BZ137_00330 [Methanosphaera sp. rholeuAM130]|nr:MAG: hypothetical protein BZ137_00330 [Methanosphaera sp. rholeuAM130]
MNTEKLLIIIFIILFLWLPAASASDGNYFISSVKLDMTVNDDGSLLVTEEIVYEIEGFIPGIKREIPLKENQS